MVFKIYVGVDLDVTDLVVLYRETEEKGITEEYDTDEYDSLIPLLNKRRNQQITENIFVYETKPILYGVDENIYLAGRFYKEIEDSPLRLDLTIINKLRKEIIADLKKFNLDEAYEIELHVIDTEKSTKNYDKINESDKT